MNSVVCLTGKGRSRGKPSLISTLFFCISGGAFGIHTFLLSYSEAVAGWYLAGVVVLSILASAQTLLLSRTTLKWPIWTLLIFGLLPFVHFVAIVAQGGSQRGSFAYLYTFAPYLTGVYWASKVRRNGLGVVTFAVKAYAAVVGIRQIAAFLVLTSAGLPAPNAVYDATYVYSYVGSLPRVFGPGIMIIALAVLLYLDDWSRRELSPGGRVGLGVAVMASATTFTRGTNLVLIAMAIASLFLPLRAGHRRRMPQTLKTLAGVVCLVAIVLTVYLANSGYWRELLPDAGDRVTLDTATFDWRSAQLDRAFIASEAWRQNWLFGVGPSTFIQNDTNDVHSTVNELHYSYASVLWTFGAVGLVCLLASLLDLVVLGRNLIGRSSVTLGWYLGIWMSLIVGIYTPTFTEPTAALELTVCAAALVGSMAGIRGRPYVRIPVGPVTSIRTRQGVYAGLGQ
jgi:hypothetical protein